MKISILNKSINLPDYLIVGGARCGTSSLYSYLSEHPEIFMPELKEPHFFNYFKKNISPHPNSPPWTIEAYSSLFKDAVPNQKIGEASASYLHFYDEVIPVIKEIYGQKTDKIKIIIVLRNPIERAWSYYSLLKRRGGEGDFFKMVENYCCGKRNKFHDFISAGRYSTQVKNYRNCFDSVKVFLFEELVGNPAMITKQIFRQLELKDIDFVPNNISIVYNSSGTQYSSIGRVVSNILFNDNKIKSTLKPFLQINYSTAHKSYNWENDL